MAAEKTLLNQVELYEVEEIAQLVGASAATIRKCIVDGRLRAQRIGRKWKVTRENALSFLNGGDAGRSEDWKDGSMEPSSPAVVQPSNLPAVQSAGETEAASQTQLLFLKPEDLDRLVSALAIHVERIERLSERRETELRDLVERLSDENEALKDEVRELRDEHREGVREAAQKILDELNSAERVETERFRFRWIQDQLMALSQAAQPIEMGAERRRWWPFGK